MTRLPLALVLLCGVANAGGDRWRLEGGLGVRTGSFLVDNASSGTIHPGHLDLGMRHDRLLVYAEYELMSVSYPMPGDVSAARGGFVGSGTGLVHRLGAAARWSYGRVGQHDGGADLYAEGGLGVEHFVWDAGGVWTRPDLELGLGLASWGASDARHGGLSLGIHVTIAHRNDVSPYAPPACGGPCDMATPPTGWDRSFLFDTTIMFGR